MAERYVPAVVGDAPDEHGLRIVLPAPSDRGKPVASGGQLVHVDVFTPVVVKPAEYPVGLVRDVAPLPAMTGTRLFLLL